MAQQCLPQHSGGRGKPGISHLGADPLDAPAAAQSTGDRFTRRAGRSRLLDYRLDELVVYLSTQGGQVKRLALSQMLGLPEQKVRVIAPDVGGGFGGKNRIMPEDVAVAAIALKVKHP